MSSACYQCGAESLPQGAVYCPHCGGSVDGTTPAEAAIELREVRKSFDGRPVLQGLDLRVARGESLVIVGLSGSGKSVLMEHMIGFLAPDSGVVRVGDVEISEHPGESRLQQMRSNLGMVFQGSALIDSLTVLENVALPLTARGVAPQTARAQAEQQLKLVGLSPTEIGPLYPAQLSGGMQKRVGIARALASQPEIILYDEPTTGLDAATTQEISRLMRKVSEERPAMTAVTITHDYFSAGLIADRILFLDGKRGRLLEVLTPEQMLALRRSETDPNQTATAVRDKMEAFFSQVDIADRPKGQGGSEISWLQALMNVTTAVLGAMGRAMLLLPQIGAPSFDRLFLRRVMELGYESLLMTALTGLFLGVMLTVQIGLALNSLYSLLPELIGMILVDKVGPLFVGLLLAGRIGANVSADIGGKRLSRQFDALKAMAISPQGYWLRPIFWAAVCALPVLMVVLVVSGLIGGCLMASVSGYVTAAQYFEHVFDRVNEFHFVFGLVRAALFGAAISVVAYSQGALEKRSSEDVGKATTEAVVAASIGVIALDFLMTFSVSLLFPS